MEEEMKASGLPHSALVGEPGTLGKVLDGMTGAGAPLYRGPDAQGFAEESAWQH